ncbi:hypothetical protein D3C72_1372400 [compost metagenome]
MRYQHQGHVHRVVEQQVLLQAQLLVAARAADRRRHGAGHALHVAQDALDHLFQVSLALAQVLVLHLVELARDDLELGGERPLCVVQALGDPVLDAAREGLVLQQHQVHVEQRGEFVRRVGRHVGLQALQLLDHRIAPVAHPLNFALDLLRLHKIVRHIHAAGGHQHRAADGDAASNCKTVDGESHGGVIKGSTGPVEGRSRWLTRPRQICRR